MRFSMACLAALMACAMAPGAMAGGDGPNADFVQNGKLNIALSILHADAGSQVTAFQQGQTNMFFSAQAPTSDRPFQLGNGELTLNSLTVIQLGQVNLSAGSQVGIINEASVNQFAVPGGAPHTEFRKNSYQLEELPDGGVAFDFVSGDVEITARYDVDGYHASSSFGRSH